MKGMREPMLPGTPSSGVSVNAAPGTDVYNSMFASNMAQVMLLCVKTKLSTYALPLLYV